MWLFPVAAQDVAPVRRFVPGLPVWLPLSEAGSGAKRQGTAFLPTLGRARQVRTLLNLSLSCMFLNARGIMLGLV